MAFFLRYALEDLMTLSISPARSLPISGEAMLPSVQRASAAMY